jgi:hypothetical protein
VTARFLPRFCVAERAPARNAKGRRDSGRARYPAAGCPARGDQGFWNTSCQLDGIDWPVEVKKVPSVLI